MIEPAVTKPATTKDIIYIADPMCSWCWGFAPVIAAIADQVAGRASLSLVVGGLRPGTTRPMSAEMKSEIRHHWEEVGKATGQPFTFDFFDRDGFVYDTEPPCRAAVSVRALQPEAALPYLEGLHRAFYVDNLDITDAGTLTNLAGFAGLDKDAFAETFAAGNMIDATLDDFRLARTLGINGFPAVIVKDTSGYGLLTLGYRSYDTLEPVLESWLEDEPQSQRA